MNSKKSSLATDQLFLVVDAGTTNLKTFLFDTNLAIVDKISTPLVTYSPMKNWAEQDPIAIYNHIVDHIKQLGQGREDQMVAMGIATQRESVTLWDQLTHEPLYPLISWQDKRTSDFCRDMNHTPNYKKLIREKTGLIINDSFSAPKIHWLLNAIDMMNAKCGTLDTWLLYKLSKQHTYATGRTNASRTLLFNIKTLAWDEELLDLFGVPSNLLAEVRPSFADFGCLDPQIFGKEIPIYVVAGDQQASLYAAGAAVGTIKLTYGTGIFAMKILPQFSVQNGSLTTLAIGDDDERLYALEGKVEHAAIRVAPALADKEKLTTIDAQLALETTAMLQTILTSNDKIITVDGGMSEDNILINKQTNFLENVQLVRQKVKEGTALGIAKLLKDRLFN